MLSKAIFFFLKICSRELFARRQTGFFQLVLDYLYCQMQNVSDPTWLALPNIWWCERDGVVWGVMLSGSHYNCNLGHTLPGAEVKRNAVEIQAMKSVTQQCCNKSSTVRTCQRDILVTTCPLKSSSPLSLEGFVSFKNKVHLLTTQGGPLSLDCTQEVHMWFNPIMSGITPPNMQFMKPNNFCTLFIAIGLTTPFIAISVITKIVCVTLHW